MTNVVVRPGHTLLTHGTLTSGSVDVLGGNAAEAGGVLVVLSSAAIDGTVNLHGSSAPNSRAAYGLIGPQGVVEATTIALYSAGGYTAQAVQGAGATLTIDGSLDCSHYLGVGYASPYAGTGFRQGGSATLNIAPGGTLTTVGFAYAVLEGSGAAGVPGSVVNDAGIWTDNYIAFTATYAPDLHGDGAVLNVTGELLNQHYIAFEHNASGLLNVAASGVLINSGGIAVTSTSRVEVAGTLDSSSAIYVSRASAAATAPSVDVTGVLNNVGTKFDVQGGYNFSGNTFGGVVSVSGTLTNGSMTTTSATIEVEGGGGAASPDVGSGGTLNLSGVFDNYNNVQVLGGGGYNGASSGPPGYGGQGGVLVDSGTLLNDGSIYVGAGQIGRTATGQGAVLSITSTGQLTGTGTIAGGGTIENLGIIHTSGNAVLSVGDLVNEGAISLSIGGALTIAGPINAGPGAAGSLTIAADSVLTLEGAVGRDQSVSFAGPGATLALADARGFAGVLTAITAGASIDFLNLDITAAHAAGTILGIDLAGGGTLDLSLGALIASHATLSLTSDNHGGTDLTLNEPSDVISGGSGSYGLTGHDAFGAQAGSVGVLTVHLPA